MSCERSTRPEFPEPLFRIGLPTRGAGRATTAPERVRTKRGYPAEAWLAELAWVLLGWAACIATCGAGAAIAGRAIPDAIPLPCAEAIAGRTAREAIAIKKRRMVSTWVPGPPGLSCTYMYKDAPSGVGVSSNTGGRGVGAPVHPGCFPKE